MVLEIALILEELILVDLVVEVESLMVVKPLEDLVHLVKDMLVVQDVVHHHRTVELVVVVLLLLVEMETVQMVELLQEMVEKEYRVV